MEMYAIHFLSLVFFLNVIRGSTGGHDAQEGELHSVVDPGTGNSKGQGNDQTGASGTPNQNRTLVTKVIEGLWNDKTGFHDRPERVFLLEILDHLPKEPTLITKKDTNNKGDASTEDLQAKTAQTPSSASTTDKELLLLNFADSVNSGTRENFVFDNTRMTQSVQDLINDQTMLSDLEPIIGELYKEFVEDLYLDIDNVELQALHARFALTVSNIDFLYFAADLVMVSGPGTFNDDAMLYVIGLMSKNMNLLDFGSYFVKKGFTLENSGRPSIQFSQDDMQKTMTRFTNFKQAVIDSIPDHVKQARRDSAIKRAKSIIDGEELKEHKSPNLHDLLLDTETKAYEFREVISALELFVIPNSPPKKVEDISRYAESYASDVYTLLNIKAPYSYKSAIAQFLLSQRSPMKQKKVFAKFFGRKLSEFIAKLPQAGKVYLLRELLTFVGSKKDMGGKYASEILLRFPQLLAVDVTKAAADHRIRYWRGEKIEAFLHKLKDKDTEIEANPNSTGITIEIKRILSETFNGIYDNIANSILNPSLHQTMPATNKSLLETLSNEPHGNFVLFSGEKDPFSNFYKCQFTGIAMFGPKEEVTCHRTEKWLMLNKAWAFGDKEIASLIKRMINADINPQEFQKLGQVINDFKLTIWNPVVEEILYQGIAHKFTQDEKLFKHFKAAALVEGRIFFEANKRDQVYGIGLAKDDPRAQNMVNHRGDNIFGLVLTKLWNDVFPPNFSELDQNAPIKIPYPRYFSEESLKWVNCIKGQLTTTVRKSYAVLLAQSATNEGTLQC